MKRLPVKVIALFFLDNALITNKFSIYYESKTFYICVNSTALFGFRP